VKVADTWACLADSAVVAAAGRQFAVLTVSTVKWVFAVKTAEIASTALTLAVVQSLNTVAD
jgi:hypothetical protein